MATCGAKTRSGHPCQAKAMPNGRCRMHGGNATKTHKGNQNARKHGIYSDAIGADERALWDEIEIGNLDHAIKVAHLQLRRALLAQKRAEAGDGLDLDAEINSSGSGDGGGHSNTSIQRRRRPYEDIINRLLGRIGDLEAKRAEILNKAAPTTDVADLLASLIAGLPG